MKTALINIAALICAIAVFSGTVVYSASELPVVDTSIEPVTQDENFLQDDDLSLGDLIDEQNSSQESSSEVMESEISSKEEVSSSPQSSSKQPSSAPPKKEPVSSKASSSSTPSKESSKPPQSSSIPVIEIEFPSEPSSEEQSSQAEVDVADPQLLDILAGAVQREIVGTNTVPFQKYYEAYKAQAVACHTYMEYHKARTGSYPQMSYSKPNAQTISLVAQVLNELIYYNGSLINAAYHAASGGSTQSSSYVWSGNIPYLTGVESKYDEYLRTTAVSVSEVEDKLTQYGISVSGDPSTWFDLTGASLTDGSFVDYIPICGQSVRARTLRENILGTGILRSTKIVDIVVNGDNFIFTTKGYGHGAGLSQQGALGYAANEGWNYKTILTHYYSGVTIQ